MNFNIAITMLLGGLWHGSSWNFVIWGGIHGLLLMDRPFRDSTFFARVPRIVRQVLFFHVICFTWVFFRAQTLADSRALLSRLLFNFNGSSSLPIVAALLVLAVGAIHLLNESDRLRSALSFKPLRVGVLALMLIYLVFVSSEGTSPFIYFQF